MRPDIYKMTKNIDDIKVPIITMGIGWKSPTGKWSDTYNYYLNKQSLELLDRIDRSGYISSVRDYHTLNTIRFKGFKNFVMTGCPASYDINYINKKELKSEIKIDKVAFSLGVSFVDSPSMEKIMKENILICKEKFSDIEFEVAFHHSLDVDKFLSTHNARLKHVKKHNQFADWLKRNSIKYIDISGSAENLIKYYSTVDFHIGYRVHAHIFMNSISKPSILICEDGRGIALKDVIGGTILVGIEKVKDTILDKALSRIFYSYDRINPNYNINKELIQNVEYEQKYSFFRSLSTRQMIDRNFLMMKMFIEQLP